jgi:gliding motility-associated-like protein
MDSDTMLVTIEGEAPIISLGMDTMICEGTTLILTPSVSTTATLLWQDGSSQPALHLNLPADSILVAMLAAPLEFSLGADTILCPGESITVTAPTTTDALLWSTGSTDSSVSASSGSIWLSISNTCGTQADSLFISVNSDVLNVEIDPLYQICDGQSVVVDVTQAFDVQYTWSTGSSESVLNFNETGTHSVTVTSYCESIVTSFDILVEDCSEPLVPVQIYIPNVFSPNDDNLNDLFIPQVNLPARIGDYRLTIFNRWGDVIFSSDNPALGWDGTFDEKKLDPGVFVFTLQWRDLSLPSSQKGRIVYGDVTLIR